jgi:hypothetical protein
MLHEKKSFLFHTFFIPFFDAIAYQHLTLIESDQMKFSHIYLHWILLNNMYFFPALRNAMKKKAGIFFAALAFSTSTIHFFCIEEKSFSQQAKGMKK